VVSPLEAQKKQDPPKKDGGKTPNKEAIVALLTVQSVSATNTSAPASPPPAESTTTEKPVSRAALTWRQTSRADFGGGTSRGVSVTSLGDLKLAPSLKRVQSSTESFIWSMVSDGKAGLFLGT